MVGSFYGLIEPDEGWLAQAPTFVNDEELNERLQNAFHEHVIFNENGREGLRYLRRFGLVADITSLGSKASTSSAMKQPTQLAQESFASSSVIKSSSTTTISATAHNIAQTLLNYSTINNKPCPYKFSILLDNQEFSDTNEENLAVPTSSRLMLNYLSQVLNINVYLFSSRSKAHLYQVDGAKGSIGFYHWIDSFNGASTFLVLAKSRTLLVQNMVIDDTWQQGEEQHRHHIAVFREGERKRKSVVTTFDGISKQDCLEALDVAW